MCQEYGLYVAVAGLMLANKKPVSAWNPVRGPKNMKIQYPYVFFYLLVSNDFVLTQTSYNLKCCYSITGHTKNFRP